MRLTLLWPLLAVAACSAFAPTYTAAQPLGSHRTVPVHVVRLARTTTAAARPTDAEVLRGIQKANDVFARVGIHHVLKGTDRYVVDSSLVSDERSVFSQADIAPLLTALSLPTTFCGRCCGATCAGQQVNSWLNDIYWEKYGPEAMVAWSGDWSGGNDAGGTSIRVAAGMVPGPGFSHEIGHDLGLSHPFDIGGDCRWWDLLYYGSADGGYRFFSSRADCDSFMAGADDPTWLRRIDPRDRHCDFWDQTWIPAGTMNHVQNNSRVEQESLRTTLTRDLRFTSRSDCLTQTNSATKVNGFFTFFSIGYLDGNVQLRSADAATGKVTIRLPCRGCTFSNTFTSDDREIRGYARKLGAGSRAAYGINVMTYYSALDEAEHFISDAQAEVIQENLRTVALRAQHGHAISANPNYLYDFDGDGKRDVALWTPPAEDCTAADCPHGRFEVLLSSEGYAILDSSRRLIRDFGILGDVPVLADYDGDGLTDLAVFRPGPLRESSSSQPSTRTFWRYCASSLDYDCSRPVTKPFGEIGDIPLPRTNFLGTWADGEAAIYRPSTGGVFWASMCTPGTSAGGTTCGTTWFGPLNLGAAYLHLMPDLWDGDDRTDLVALEPLSGTVKFRMSSSGFTPVNRTLSAPFTIDGGGFGLHLVPSYRAEAGGPMRRVLAFVQQSVNGSSATWSTLWNTNLLPWLFQGCFLSAQEGGRVPVGGVSLNGRSISGVESADVVVWDPGSRMLTARDGSAGCSVLWQRSISTSSSSSTMQVAAGADMTGDGVNDILAWDQQTATLRIIDATTGVVTVTKAFGGPRTRAY